LILNTGYWIQDTEYRNQDTGYWILDTGYRILDTGYGIRDTGYRILGTCVSNNEPKACSVGIYST